jgi:hypothetical protein
MDTADMTFDAGPIHTAFPGLPATTLAEALGSQPPADPAKAGAAVEEAPPKICQGN